MDEIRIFGQGRHLALLVDCLGLEGHVRVEMLVEVQVFTKLLLREQRLELAY